MLAGCNIPKPAITPINQVPATKLPTSTPDTNRPCGFQWATQPLTDLTRDVELALKDAGLSNFNARAEAYGENCIDENGEVVYFATMETDFHITLKAKDLNDTDELGQLLDTALSVLDNFPPDETPGPQAGYIGITFEAQNDSMRLWFALTKVDSLLQQGLSGEELLNALKNQ